MFINIQECRYCCVVWSNQALLSMKMESLPKREREVMDLVYLLEQADVRDVQQQLVRQPTYSATRMLLQRLHKKGLLQAERDGNR